MSSEMKLASNLPPSQARRPATFSISGMLTRSELDSQRREMGEAHDLMQKAFEKYRPKADLSPAE